VKGRKEIIILIYQNTRRHIPKDNDLHNPHRKNSKSHIPVSGCWAPFYFSIRRHLRLIEFNL